MIRGKKELLPVQRRSRKPEAVERIVDAGGGRGQGWQPFWGKIITCNYSVGTATVKRCAGTLGSLSIVDGAEERTAWQGPGGWHIVGEEVYVMWAGLGVTPEWIIDQRIGYARHWEPPTEGELADVQDDPDAVTTCPAES